MYKWEGVSGGLVIHVGTVYINISNNNNMCVEQVVFG